MDAAPDLGDALRMAPWALISGERREGRDDVVRPLVDRWRAAGLSVGGCTQVPVFGDAGRPGGDDEPLGYDALGFDGVVRPVARLDANPTLCGFSFVDETFATIRAELAAARPDITVLPGAKLESAEQGHWPTVQDTLQAEHGLLVFVLRPHLLSRVALKLPDPVAYLELPSDEAAVAAFEEEVRVAALSARAASSGG